MAQEKEGSANAIDTDINEREFHGESRTALVTVAAEAVAAADTTRANYNISQKSLYDSIPPQAVENENFAGINQEMMGILREKRKRGVRGGVGAEDEDMAAVSPPSQIDMNLNAVEDDDDEKDRIENGNNSGAELNEEPRTENGIYSEQRKEKEKRGDMDNSLDEEKEKENSAKEGEGMDGIVNGEDSNLKPGNANMHDMETTQTDEGNEDRDGNEQSPDEKVIEENQGEVQTLILGFENGNFSNSIPRRARSVLPTKMRPVGIKSQFERDFESVVPEEFHPRLPDDLDHDNAGVEATTTTGTAANVKQKRARRHSKSSRMAASEAEAAKALFDLADAAEMVQEEAAAAEGKLLTNKRRSAKLKLPKGKGSRGGKAGKQPASDLPEGTGTEYEKHLAEIYDIHPDTWQAYCENLKTMNGMDSTLKDGATQPTMNMAGLPQQGASPNYIAQNPMALWQQAAMSRMGGGVLDDQSQHAFLMQQQQQMHQQQRRSFMPRCAAHVYIAHFIDYQQKLAQNILLTQQYQQALFQLFANNSAYTGVQGTSTAPGTSNQIPNTSPQKGQDGFTSMSSLGNIAAPNVVAQAMHSLGQETVHSLVNQNQNGNRGEPLPVAAKGLSNDLSTQQLPNTPTNENGRISSGGRTGTNDKLSDEREEFHVIDEKNRTEDIADVAKLDKKNDAKPKTKNVNNSVFPVPMTSNPTGTATGQDNKLHSSLTQQSLQDMVANNAQMMQLAQLQQMMYSGLYNQNPSSYVGTQTANTQPSQAGLLSNAPGAYFPGAPPYTNYGNIPITTLQGLPESFQQAPNVQLATKTENYGAAPATHTQEKASQNDKPNIMLEGEQLLRSLKGNMNTGDVSKKQQSRRVKTFQDWQKDERDERKKMKEGAQILQMAKVAKLSSGAAHIEKKILSPGKNKT